MSIFRIVLPTRAGSTFAKSREKGGRKVKHGDKIMSDTLKYYQNRVGYIKMSPKLCRIHEDPLFEVQLGWRGGDKGERSEQQSEGAEHHRQNRFWAVSSSKQIRFRIVLPTRTGIQFP